MNKADKLFIENLMKIQKDGYDTAGDIRPVYKDGSKAHSRYITNVYEEYDLTKGEFPITTLRPIAWKTAIRELFVIYVDQEHTQEAFHKRGIKYWDEWMFIKMIKGWVPPGLEPFHLNDRGNPVRWGGRRYGETVKKYGIIDKILKGLEENPFNRRSIINLWQYADFEETEGLVPCAYNFMVDVREIDGEKHLDATLVQRSNDIMVAGAINKIQYVALQMMIACHFGWKVGKFSHYVMNLHYYSNQEDQLNEMMDRVVSFNRFCASTHIDIDQCKQLNIELARDFNNDEPWSGLLFKKPELKLTCAPGTNFYDIKPEDFVMDNYHPDHRQLRFELAI